jgi:hypothetical protein
MSWKTVLHTKLPAFACSHIKERRPGSGGLRMALVMMVLPLLVQCLVNGQGYNHWHLE